MTRDWRERLRDSNGQFFGRRPARVPVGAVDRQPIAINLGIDFGTSFSKVCFRDVGAEHSGIVTFRSRTVESALVPSVVAIDEAGRLSIGDHSRNHGRSVRYLKMGLAGMPIAHVAGGELSDPEVCGALSSWYLATLTRKSQDWIERHEPERVLNRRIVWSANVGVPVEHYNSPAIETFRKTLAIAWIWQQKAVPPDLNSTLEAYRAAQALIGGHPIDCHAVPEIAAAVQSFIISREALPGRYLYFDIGGGTVDGVAFDFISDDGERRVNFYSGKVASLGIAVALARLGADTSRAEASMRFSACCLLLGIQCSAKLVTNFRNSLQK